jgi:hypothetical protein
MFITHTGEKVDGFQLERAINKVADWYVANAHAVYKEDNYATHVTEATKIDILNNDLKRSQEIRNGKHLNNFTIWQRINTELTGKCVAFLPK